jgi:topoisomerase-4 subunit B
MYTRTDSPTHIIQEVLDNAADEALAGFARNIEVSVYKDGSVSVRDDGRGIPVDIPKGEKVPAVELVFTELHSGGKFDKGEEGSSYGFSGGLHGVGVSVTNALSTKLEVEVRRDGIRHRLAFAEGDVTEELHKVGTCLKRETGTYVRAWPNPKYFDNPGVNLKELEHLVRSKAVLLPGVSMTLLIEGADGFTEKKWHYENGLADYLNEILPESDDPEFEPIPIFTGQNYISEAAEGVAKGEGGEWAISFRPRAGGTGESYVNLIPTLTGGTHVTGMRLGIFEAVRSFMEHHGLMQSKIKIAAEDVWANLNYVLSAKILDPQFQGQTKETLTSKDAYKLLANSIRTPLEVWLNQNVEYGKRIADLTNKSAIARTRSKEKVEKRRSSGINLMPAKLADSEAAGTLDAELFLVEGDSAGGSAKEARNREFQSILPLRGKVMNTWEEHSDQIFSNNEIHDMFVAIGIDPHTYTGTRQHLENLRYGKICILADADVDGSHIQALLLTLFLRHAPDLIANGHIYIARSPLYRIDVPAQGKSKPARIIYVSDDAEKEAQIDKLEREGVREDRLKIQRFKGLGEMNPDQLWDTTLNPDTRRLLQIKLDGNPNDIFEMLMAKGETDARRQWMERRANDVEGDI